VGIKAQTKKYYYQGIVTDATGKTLIGMNVSKKGTTTGTIIDLNKILVNLKL
jgi:hypothetical protein